MAVMRFRARYRAFNLWFLGKLASAGMSLSVKSIASSFWQRSRISFTVVVAMLVGGRTYRDEAQVL